MHEMVPGKWCTEIMLYQSDLEDLGAFKKRTLADLHLSTRCHEMEVNRFNVEIANRSFEPSPGFKNGRVFAVDCQQAWAITVPFLVSQKRELLGMFQLKLLSNVGSMISWSEQ